MITIERNFCIITGNTDMEDLHTMDDFPVFMGCVDHGVDQDIFSELTWQINKNSGLLQLKKLIPLDILYEAEHAPGTVGSTWMEHHLNFVNFMSKFKPGSVLEIGGAHGILSVEYRKQKKIPWTIIEPNPTPIKECEARFVKGFFDESFKYDDEFDTIVHSHLFEHIYNPDEFMKQLSDMLGEGQKLIFSIPNLQVMLERKYTNALNFEHTVFITEPYVEFLLTKYNFRLEEKKYFKDDHSIFYAAVRCSAVELKPLTAGLYAKNKKLYLDFVDYHIRLINELNDRIKEITQPIYLFGAHVFAQYLIEMGLKTNKIVCILDNDLNKQGSRLYGTTIQVTSPSILVHVEKPVVILKAGTYNDEIKKDILENINSSTTFLE